MACWLRATALGSNLSPAVLVFKHNKNKKNKQKWAEEVSCVNKRRCSCRSIHFNKHFYFAAVSYEAKVLPVRPEVRPSQTSEHYLDKHSWKYM
jgi:hypothetical protein